MDNIEAELVNVEKRLSSKICKQVDTRTNNDVKRVNNELHERFATLRSDMHGDMEEMQAKISSISDKISNIDGMSSRDSLSSNIIVCILPVSENDQGNKLQKTYP
ncbi:hypothetical protein DPMN_130093 [Dreissena polymorpha]|uniref:Uncharacterized protein n=1 Tax=Dreissena polymorpha TaxID=45954 RepID=A0A9D4JY28_DREPO|nr:hypothetical protein DPMN_130093 [Dreissena polymorpha]